MKDLTQFLTPDLELKLGGRTYTVRPPTFETGLKLAALNAAGMSAYVAAAGKCPTCNRANDLQLEPETAELIATLKDVPLGEVSLGKDVFDRMVADGLPEKHIDKAALYAMYYWVLGESSADKILQAVAQQENGEGAGQQAPKASRTGRSTASGRQTKTVSTPSTESPST